MYIISLYIFIHTYIDYGLPQYSNKLSSSVAAAAPCAAALGVSPTHPYSKGSPTLLLFACNDPAAAATAAACM